jgi:hypothetical protein
MHRPRKAAPSARGDPRSQAAGRVRRRARWLVLGWATPVGAGTIAGIVIRLPDDVSTGTGVVVILAATSFVVPTLLAAVLAVLESPGMTERLVRVINAFRRGPIDDPEDRGGGQHRTRQPRDGDRGPNRPASPATRRQRRGAA